MIAATKTAHFRFRENALWQLRFNDRHDQPLHAATADNLEFEKSFWLELGDFRMTIEDFVASAAAYNRESKEKLKVVVVGHAW